MKVEEAAILSFLNPTLHIRHLCRPSPLSLESPAETKAGDDPVDEAASSKAAPSPVASSASYAPTEEFESSPAPSPRGSPTSPADKVEAASALASLGGVDDATTNSTLPGVGESSGDEGSRPCNANKVVETSDESDSEQTGRNAGKRKVDEPVSSNAKSDTKPAPLKPPVGHWIFTDTSPMYSNISVKKATSLDRHLQNSAPPRLSYQLRIQTPECVRS
ncbi:unnamed protein product [Phytophthora lilii]|uniref:Unnamed protein product n=1 Tax=Phytophthora lilii TaxID=2077276 RepID=A0A9W6TLU8_9STRA|nr:unnamed protein product [Phytophthora lilii]